MEYVLSVRDIWLNSYLRATEVFTCAKLKRSRN